MKDNQKDQKTQAAKVGREERKVTTPVAKPGFKTSKQDEEEGTESKSYSRPSETGHTNKPGESSHGRSSREDEDEEDREQRTGEEQDEENEEIEPTRRIKTPFAGQHSEDSKSQKQNNGSPTRKF
jgi:hypothetical protein